MFYVPFSSKTTSLDPNKPLIVPFGQDNFEQIGMLLLEKVCSRPQCFVFHEM